MVGKIEKPETVTISVEILDSFICAFSAVEREKLFEIYEDIVSSIEDAYEGIPPEEIIKQPDFDIQAIFKEIEKIIPDYTPLLRKSMDEVGDELHVDEAEANRIFNGMLFESEFRPKIQMDDGTTNFSYMQIAARKAGIKDDNLRFWYVFLGMFIGNSLCQEQH